MLMKLSAASAKRRLSSLMLVAWLMLTGTATAMAEPEKFGLLRDGNATVAEFGFDAPALNFSTAVTEEFVWYSLQDADSAFDDYRLLDDLTARYIGYAVNRRDEMNIRVYSAATVPQRQALAADYARMLAARWGPLDFGVMAHSPSFGEVLAGDNSSGEMIVNRISVFKHGASLLIVRSQFLASHFETYADDMARFIGSLDFASTEDPTTAMKTAVSDFPDRSGTLTYPMPEHWQQLAIRSPQPAMGTIDFWVDTADPNRNAAIMVAVLDVGPDAALDPAAPDQQRLANLAGNLVRVALQNLLDTEAIALEPQVLTPYSETGSATFKGLYAFKATVEGVSVPIEASAFISIGPGGPILTVTKVSVWPVQPHATGTNMHANFVMSGPFAAIRAYWMTGAQ